ncbi:hypothetical protein DdX_16641 [Ditylenchus destructor]|uniref:Uncharacterized protein n=1 Tax=Ditylenchus destructor TaxID=166010 RepID=A0AAD4MN28_9BILA|nr:hypothetical protein DdX_16641 [Ditylenchus destructor]
MDGNLNGVFGLNQSKSPTSADFIALQRTHRFIASLLLGIVIPRKLRLMPWENYTRWAALAILIWFESF